MSSMQHGAGNAANRGNCQQFQNPLDSAPVQRALFVALDQWVTQGVAAAGEPASEARGRHAGAAVAASGNGLPEHSGRDLHGAEDNPLPLQLRPGFPDDGYSDFQPADFSLRTRTILRTGPIYPSHIPKTDVDGNDIAGVQASQSGRAPGDLHGLGVALGRASQ